MPQMSTAVAAEHFGAHHAKAAVHTLYDLPFFGPLIEGGPSASAVELGTGGEQHRATSRARIDALLKMHVIFAGECSLSAMLSKHVILLVIQLGLPLFLAPLHGETLIFFLHVVIFICLLNNWNTGMVLRNQAASQNSDIRTSISFTKNMLP
jgi:hypothetical protein